MPMIAPDSYLEVLRPIRVGRSLAMKPGELERRVQLAALMLGGGPGGILVLLDADDDCAAELAPKLAVRVRDARPDVPFAVVLAVKEFEAWFLASIESLAGRRGLPPEIMPPPDPESVRDAKRWLQDRRRDGLAYSPVVDQPALAAVFDPHLARSRSPSFDKLWRELDRLLAEMTNR
jgi:hypothetical protein